MRIILAIFSMVLMSSCASMHVYDMPKVQGELGQTIQSTEAIIQKSQSDFKDKSALVENLKRANDPAFAPAEVQLRRHLKAMETSLSVMTTRRKQMIDANGAVAAMGYTHKEVRGDAPEYDKVDAAVADFQEAAKDINAAVLDYSNESNSLADEVSSHKLFYNFDVNEFQKRVQLAIKTSQTNLETMKKDINHAAETLNSAGKSEAQEQIFSEMNKGAQSYADRAQHFAEISQAVHDAALGNGKVSTLDSNWPPIQKLLTQFDALVAELSAGFEKFQGDVERFRKPFKRAQ